MAASDVDSNYNASADSLTKRKGFLTSSVAYTYSKAMGIGGGVGDAYNENPEARMPVHVPRQHSRQSCPGQRWNCPVVAGRGANRRRGGDLEEILLWQAEL